MHLAPCIMHHACSLTATVSSFFGAAAFRTTKIDDFRASLTLTSLTTSSTNSSKRRLLRWTSMNRQMMEAIEVDQLKETNNGRPS